MDKKVNSAVTYIIYPHSHLPTLQVSIVSANGLVRLLQRNADSLSGHVKFAKLIINLCKQYGHEV